MFGLRDELVRLLDDEQVGLPQVGRDLVERRGQLLHPLLHVRLGDIEDDGDVAPDGAAHHLDDVHLLDVLVAVLGLILFGAEGLLIGNLFTKLVAYIVTAVPLTLLAYWVARKV